ncbi:DUF1259 domain-containing protein [Sutcliffiella cohnii]|uniref:DUF1259 domain-containing protein n=1 Tax=Sutcliffiella cohnii TaxID=33932 RepID=UPI002E1C9C29|nr:DUF1259 domain-containing protein [Sutcliffiella cohnii]
MPQNVDTICQQFGQIFKETPKINNGVCSVEIERNLKVTIQDRPSRGELHAEVSFESLDQEGNALNLGETVILEEEIQAFTNSLSRNGIIISAIHNHWLYTVPTILYVHFQSVEPPLNFARKVAEAFKVLRTTNTDRQMEDYGALGALNAISLTLPQMLTYALQDEYLAQARYNNIIATFGNIRTFVQIKEAEMRHISALLPLFERYQVPLPIDISQSLVTTPDNLKAAYAAGVQGEIENISMYDKFLTMNIPTDVRNVFTQLRNASVNHLAAFERGLARK